MKTIVLGAMIGAAAGLLGALLGVGGGILMVPFFVLAMGKEMHSAVATSLVVIIVTSVSSTLSNATAAGHLIDWKLALAAGIAAAAASWYGSALMRSLESKTLTQGFGAFLVVMGIWMFLKK